MSIQALKLNRTLKKKSKRVIKAKLKLIMRKVLMISLMDYTLPSQLKSKIQLVLNGICAWLNSLSTIIYRKLTLTAVECIRISMEGSKLLRISVLIQATLRNFSINVKCNLLSWSVANVLKHNSFG